MEPDAGDALVSNHVRIGSAKQGTQAQILSICLLGALSISSLNNDDEEAQIGRNIPLFLSIKQNMLPGDQGKQKDWRIRDLNP